MTAATMANQAQPDHEGPIQEFLTWERSAGHDGTVGVRNELVEKYITKSDLFNYLTEDRVFDILNVMLSDRAPSAQYVSNRYRRCLAILLSIGAGPMIGHFVESSDLQDDNLPLQSRPVSFPVSTAQRDLFEEFSERQRRYTAVELHNGMRGDLTSQRLLPFQVKEQIGEGASAFVYRIEVTQDRDLNKLHRPSAPQATSYVLKTFRGVEAERNYKIEKEAFERLNSLDSHLDNLIGFHGTFMRGGGYNMILEYADQGSLRTLLQRSPPSRPEDILDCWRSIADLLMGVHHLHQNCLGRQSGFQYLTGWHQDIKPENILLKSKENAVAPFVFECLLADLGHSHFKVSESSNRAIKDTDTGGTRAYGAPEIHRLDQKDRNAEIRATNSVDIWSCGCVLSEVAVWICHGQAMLEQYRQDRHLEVAKKIGTFEDGDLFHDGRIRLDTITEYHRSIRDHRRVNDFVTHRIVEQVIETMLEVADKREDSPRKLRREMQDAFLAAEKDLKRHRASAAQPNEPSLPPQQPERLVNGTHIPFRPNEHTENVGRARVLPRPQELSLNQGLQWKKKVKEHERRRLSGPVPTLPGSTQPMTLLQGRDHIFIVDNSETMKDHLPSLKQIVELEGFMLKKCDPTGLDIFFTNTLATKNTKKSSDLVKAIESVDFEGLTNMEHRLSSIFKEHKSGFGEKVRGPRTFRRPRPRVEDQKPISFYIFTDGLWQPENDVAQIIIDVVGAMQYKQLTKSHVAIQFIRFGDDEDAIHTLNHLDSGLGLKSIKMDIVDHEPWHGNVWKQLLGALDPFYDDDPDENIEESLT